MWDLDTLSYLNEIENQRSVERANEKARQAPSSTTAPVYPLSILAKILITGPPRLTALIDLLENSESIARFLDLVREYVPEYEAEIMGVDMDNRVRLFKHYFDPRYFPLSDQIDLDEFTIEDFLTVIPVDLMGFSYKDYHNFEDFRPSYVLMLSLIETPYLDDAEGGRVPILEAAGDIVGKGVVSLIPPDGWNLEDLHRMLDGSKYDGVLAFADWVNENTGCWQLDCNYENYEGERWDSNIVSSLANQWPEVVDIQNKIQKMAEWLEEDLKHNFEELLSHMLNRKDFIIPKEQLAFPLDEDGQVIRKEVIAVGNH